MISIFFKYSWMQSNGEENNLNRGFKPSAFCRVLMLIDISNLFRSLKFWWFAKLLTLINHSRRSWNNFFLVYYERDSFHSMRYGGTEASYTVTTTTTFCYKSNAFSKFSQIWHISSEMAHSAQNIFGFTLQDVTKVK